mgnify:CR=1 FL=1
MVVLSLQKRYFRKDKAFIVKNQEILNIYFFAIPVLCFTAVDAIMP